MPILTVHTARLPCGRSCPKAYAAAPSGPSHTSVRSPRHTLPEIPGSTHPIRPRTAPIPFRPSCSGRPEYATPTDRNQSSDPAIRRPNCRHRRSRGSGSSRPIAIGPESDIPVPTRPDHAPGSSERQRSRPEYEARHSPEAAPQERPGPTLHPPAQAPSKPSPEPAPARATPSPGKTTTAPKTTTGPEKTTTAPGYTGGRRHISATERRVS